MLARRQITLKLMKEQLRDASHKERHKRPSPAKTTSEETPDYRDAGVASTDSTPARRARGKNLHETPPPLLPTREDAMASLAATMANGKRSITLFNFKQVVESICCACGMVGNSEVCRSCPFARIILGVSGRAN